MREEDCIFCKIANGEIPSRTLYEDDDFRVILDLNPVTKGHALILPKITTGICTRSTTAPRQKCSRLPERWQ